MVHHTRKEPAGRGAVVAKTAFCRVFADGVRNSSLHLGCQNCWRPAALPGQRPEPLWALTGAWGCTPDPASSCSAAVRSPAMPRVSCALSLKPLWLEVEPLACPRPCMTLCSELAICRGDSTDSVVGQATRMPSSSEDCSQRPRLRLVQRMQLEWETGAFQG